MAAVKRVVSALLQIREGIVASADDHNNNRAEDALLGAQAGKWEAAVSEFAQLEGFQRSAVWVLCLDALARRPPRMRSTSAYGNLKEEEWVSTCRRQLRFMYKCIAREVEEEEEGAQIQYVVGGEMQRGGWEQAPVVHATVVAPAASALVAERKETGEAATSTEEVDAEAGGAEEGEEEEEEELQAYSEEQYEYSNSPRPKKYTITVSPEIVDQDLEKEDNPLLDEPIDTTDLSTWIAVEPEERFGVEFMRHQQENLIPMLQFCCKRLVMEKEFTTNLTNVIPEGVSPHDEISNYKWCYLVSGGTVRINPTIVQKLFKMTSIHQGMIQKTASFTYRLIKERKSINESLLYILLRIRFFRLRLKYKELFEKKPGQKWMPSADNIQDDYTPFEILPEKASKEYFLQTFYPEIPLFSSFLQFLIAFLNTQYELEQSKKKQSTHSPRAEIATEQPSSSSPNRYFRSHLAERFGPLTLLPQHDNDSNHL